MIMMSNYVKIYLRLFFFQWPIEGNLLGLSWLVFLECTLVLVKQEIQDGAFPTLEVSQNGCPSHHGFQYEKGLMVYSGTVR